ncbi:MAG: hypothetical protein MJZ49_00995 [Bacteroidales bacterium]|nr:hypothetical protein [Bacteroidales bacterium]
MKIIQKIKNFIAKKKKYRRLYKEAIIAQDIAAKAFFNDYHSSRKDGCLIDPDPILFNKRKWAERYIAKHWNDKDDLINIDIRIKNIDLEAVIWNIESIMETQKNLCLKEAFELYCQHIDKRILYEIPNFYADFYKFVSSSSEFQVLKEKYKDRLTEPTENDNANQNNEQK